MGIEHIEHGKINYDYRSLVDLGYWWIFHCNVSAPTGNSEMTRKTWISL